MVNKINSVNEPSGHLLNLLKRHLISFTNEALLILSAITTERALIILMEDQFYLDFKKKGWGWAEGARAECLQAAPSSLISEGPFYFSFHGRQTPG